MQIPTVNEKDARAYEKAAWHFGNGVKPLLDGVTMRFASDFANVVLKQFVAEYSVVIKKQVVDEIRAIAQKKQTEQFEQPVHAFETPKGSIVLTD
jgi:hypothetical protein